MAINWNFNADEAKVEEFAPIPVGDHRVRIAEVEEKQSSGGNDMLVLTLEVSGRGGKLWYYLPFLNDTEDKRKMTNQRLGQVFDSFGLSQDCLANTQLMLGKVGAARVKHEIYNDKTQAKVHYFIGKAKQEDLPPWEEPGGASAPAVPSGFMPIPDGDVPF